MVCTAATVLVFFSLPASKLVGYILPAVAPLAYLMTQRLSGLSDKAFKITVVCSGVLCLSVVAFFAVTAPKSTQMLGQQLHQARAQGEPVYMWHHYYYDLPLYAQLETPAKVVDQWSSPQVREHDNWQRELADASDFAPNGPHTLIENEGFHQQLCAEPSAWILASSEEAASNPWLNQLHPWLSHDQTVLIHWDTTSGTNASAAAALCASPATASPTKPL
jgi:hypothetical protein